MAAPNSDPAPVGAPPPAGGHRETAWLALILVAGLAFRLYGVNFGLPALNDPDELVFQGGTVAMLSGPTLNPGWFGHPATTTMYLLAIIDATVFGVGWLAGWFGSLKEFSDAIYADPAWVILPGRVAMVAFAVGSIHLTYRLGREIFSGNVGLAAAALLAVSPVNITWSQVIRSDIMATVFMLLIMLSAVRVAREGRMRDTVMASLWLALATATKWPFALGALAVMGAIALRIYADPAARGVELRRLVKFGALAAGLLCIISPFLLLDYETVLGNLHAEAQLRHLGATSNGPLANAAWYLSDPILTGLGAMGALLAAAGVVFMLRHREARAIILPVGVAFFVLICVQHIAWDRWVLPLLPLLAIAAGRTFVALANLLRRQLPAPARTAALAALLAALILPPSARAMSNATERLNDTRQIAAAWARAHVPAGNSILIEHFGWDLYSQPWPLLFPAGELGCIDPRALLQGKVQQSAIEKARSGRTNVDYGTLPASLRPTCTADFAILTQYERYRAQREEFPEEYDAYRRLVAGSRVVAVIRPVRGKTGGPAIIIIAAGPGEGGNRGD